MERNCCATLSEANGGYRVRRFFVTVSRSLIGAFVLRWFLFFSLRPFSARNPYGISAAPRFRFDFYFAIFVFFPRNFEKKTIAKKFKKKYCNP